VAREKDGLYGYNGRLAEPMRVFNRVNSEVVLSVVSVVDETRNGVFVAVKPQDCDRLDMVRVFESNGVYHLPSYRYLLAA